MRVLTVALLSAAAPLFAEQAIVTAKSANVRAGATTTHPVRGTLARGTVVEVLEVSGDWYRVRTVDGKTEGWVSGSLLERQAAKSPAAPVPPLRSTTSPATGSAGVGIEHRAVSCLVAEQFPKLAACFSPADNLARAQVLFRASDTSLWFAVDMRREGACFEALLPKPKRTTRQVQYFVYAIDRAFAESQRPDGAPSKPFTPRVVESKGECQDDWGMGTFGSGSAPRIVVSVARDSAGRAVNLAAQALGSPAQLTGFSADGVVMSSGTASPAQSGGAAAAGKFPVLLVAGGAAVAVAVGAVVAGGGGSSSDGASSMPAPSPASLSGSWSGAAASSRGLGLQVTASGATCTYRWDVDMTLTQSGTALVGPATINRRSVVCSVPELQAVLSPLVPGQTDGFTFAATLAPPNAITIPFGAVVLTGTYTATTIEAIGRQVTPDGTLDYKLALTKSP